MEFFLNVFHWIQRIQWQKNYDIKRTRTWHLLCKRPGCYHSSSKTHVRDWIFKLTPIHASVIISFSEFTEFSESSDSLRKNSINGVDSRLMLKLYWLIFTGYRSHESNSNQLLTTYRLGTVNSNTVNSKFHLIRSYCEIFFYHFPNISCLKCTVNSNFHLIRSKTWLINDFELTVPNLYSICSLIRQNFKS